MERERVSLEEEATMSDSYREFQVANAFGEVLGAMAAETAADIRRRRREHREHERRLMEMPIEELLAEADAAIADLERSIAALRNESR